MSGSVNGSSGQVSSNLPIPSFFNDDNVLRTDFVKEVSLSDIISRLVSDVDYNNDEYNFPIGIESFDVEILDIIDNIKSSSISNF